MPFFNYRLKKNNAQGEHVSKRPSHASEPNSSMEPSLVSSPTERGAWPPHADNANSSYLSDQSSLRRGQSPLGEFQNALPTVVKDIKCEVMVNWLYSKQEEKIWTTGEPGEGVVLKKSKGMYVCCPLELQHDDSLLYQMVAALNVRVAMTINTRVIKLLLERCDLPYVQIHSGLRLQVIPGIEALPYCQRHQSAAFIASRQILVVWEDDPKKLLERATYIQDTLMEMIWGGSSGQSADENKTNPFVNVAPIAAKDVEERGHAVEKGRKTVLMQAVTMSVTLTLTMAAISAGWRQVTVEIMVDRNWIRIAFVVCILPQIWLALFFFQALVGNITQLVGPIGQLEDNSKYYSGRAPRRLRRDDNKGLPHVTIQMPVYREGLHAVIEPTIRSIKAAISTYELQGGTANIFINDDGMQLMTDDEARKRQEFYDEHNIGWVARPRHNPNPMNAGELAFNRRGKFKKASNMNYGLDTSLRVEKVLTEYGRGRNWDQRQEGKAYVEALRRVLDESEGKTWANGDIRVGDYILLIDSDTRVPNDCLLDAVSEMEQSPQVAILQYASGVMNVTDSFFERGITFFTNLVYTQIKYAVASGDVAPFVGHNAVLRWAAMQEISYMCKNDGYEKIWSEKTVSEDFDMALRLQTNGYLVRLGAYKDDGFKEGVSLTVYDELARWEKYAYGCSELIFHPVRYWFTKGPFTRLFCNFIGSNMPLPSKVTIMAYVGTYYALGSAWLLTVVNYFIIGWFNGALDHYYIDSFKVYCAIVAVFTALGNVTLAVLRYRIGEGGLVRNLITNLKWIPLLIVFLGGVSLHVSQALLSHMFSIDMSWGATAKEVEHVTFFEEVPRVFKRFKGTLLFCVSLAVGMAILATMVPYQWRIDFFTPIWPLACVLVCHFLLPFVLNPNLMLFTW